MSATSPPPAHSPVPQLQHHHNHQRQLQEQLEQQNRHLQRLEQYRQQPILPTHSLSNVHHPHPYYHPRHSHHYVHNPQQQQPASSSPSLFTSLPIEHQAPSPSDLSSHDTAFYSPMPSWQQQPFSLVQQCYPHTPHQHHQQQSQASSSSPSSTVSPNLHQLLFAKNSIPFEGFSVPPEYACDPLSDSGPNLFATSADPDSFPASVDATNYLIGTPNLSEASGNEDTVAGLSITSSSSSSSRRVASGHQQMSFRSRVDRRIDVYRESGETSSGQSNNSNDDNNNNYNNKRLTIMPLYPNERCGSSASPAPPLSPLGMPETSGFQSTLVQSLANLTTSSPNLSCLNSPTFSSAFSQNNNCFTFSGAQKSLSISSDHLSGLSYTQGNTEDANGNKDEDNNESTANDYESDRRFQCPVCPKRFLRQYNLNAHLKTHSQVRAHACSQCDKTFLRPYDLARHQRIHSNIRPYTCNICQFIFIRNDAIWRHYRRAHPGHPDVPPARRQRRPQRIGASPGTNTTTTTTTTTATDNNINPS